MQVWEGHGSGCSLLSIEPKLQLDWGTMEQLASNADGEIVRMLTTSENGNGHDDDHDADRDID